MTKTLILALLTLSCTFAFAGDAEPKEPKLPAAVQTIMDKTNADILANRVVYTKANNKVLDAAEKSLKAELDKLTKAGKLDEAIAVRKLIEGLRVDLVANIDAAWNQKSDKPVTLDDINGISLDESIVGEWLATVENWKNTITFNNGVATIGDGTVGTYAIKNEKIVVTWKNGITSDIKLTDSKTGSFTFSDRKASGTISKIVKK